MTKSLPSVELLRQLLEYDPETGILTWKPRPVEMFAEGSRQERTCIIWNKRFAGKTAMNTSLPNGYLTGGLLKKTTYAHRAAWAIFYGEWPRQDIDHINGDRQDNRIENLRSVSRSENMRNCGMLKTNTSGTTGVSFNGKLQKWAASIQVDKKSIYLGLFSSIEEAQAARRRAEPKYRFHPNHGKRKGRPKPP